MKKLYNQRWYRPMEITKLGLILNSQGKPDYPFVLKLIKSGRLKAKDYSVSPRTHYWLVPESEIERYHNTITKVVGNQHYESLKAGDE